MAAFRSGLGLGAQEVAKGETFSAYSGAFRQGVSFVNPDHYVEAWSRCLTVEQTEALWYWRNLSIELNYQWNVHCSFKRRCAESEAAYAVWREIYDRQQDALGSMLHALCSVREAGSCNFV